MKKFTQKLGFICLIILFAYTSKAQMITTVAGNGSVGSTGNGGQATSAKLNGPAAVDFDAAGNLYIADQTNNMIRKITTAGIISTLAGTGTAGYSGDGGQATAAKLDAPTGVTLDAIGNVYVADQYTYRIRKISTSGIITTVAGNGTPTFAGDGGQATAASLYNPTCVAFDAAGNMYIGDYSNNRIRKVNSSGIISTVAGNGTAGFSGDGGQATAAKLNGAVGVAFDGAGNMFIADRNNNRIRKVTTAGIISTMTGNGTAGSTGDGGQATSAELSGPFGIGLDSYENLYIADAGNNKVRRVNSSGVITTIAGTGTAGYSGDGGYATAAELDFPAEISLGIDGNDNLYIADYGNNRVREVTYSTTFYFKTVASGNYSSASIWQASPNNSTNWAAVLVAPDYQSSGIVISSGDSVVFNSTDTLDQVTVNGTLVYGTGCTLNLNNGTGVDLVISNSAKFYDEGDNSIVWNSATWTLGSSAYMIRTRSTSSDNFRTQYDGGISTIPSSSNWIVRKTGTDNPSISTNSMYYGNLNIENNTGTTWTTSTASSFTGTAGYPTIQGNMSIGGNGTGNVSFLDTNTNAQAMIVQGNFTVTTGSTFRNHGTGCQVQGNLVLNGIVNYTSSGMFSFNGSNNQTISGTSITFNNLSLNKSSFAATVTLNSAVAINGAFTFSKGVLLTDTVHLLTFNAGSSTTGVNDSSFVNGPIKKIGNTAFIFPLGDGANAQTIAISAPTYTTDAFQAQYFDTNPTLIDSNLTDTTFDYVSTCEYFNLKRKNGTTNVQITLSYDLYSCVTQLVPAPCVIGYNGTKWINLGASNLTYSSYGGTISSGTVITQYGNITLGNNTKGGFSPLDSVFYNLNPYLTFDPEPMDSTIPFYENVGQIVDTGYHSLLDIKYYSFNQSPAVYFRPTSASFLFSKLDTIRSTPDSLHRVDMSFYGANAVSYLSPAEPVQAYLNYYLAYRPHADTNINGYQRLFAPNIYNNIDLQYYTNSDGVKYCLVVKPGAKPSEINLLFTGASSTSIDGSGRLVVTTTLGTLTLDVPILYQMNTSLIISPLSGTVSWYQISANKYGITLPAYNASMPLFIEVKKATVGASGFANQLCWGTYYGGSSDDVAYAIAHDANGNILVAGETQSANLPQPGPFYNTTGAGTTEAFVTRFRKNKSLHFSTIIGCEDGTYTNDVKAKSINDIFICGQAGKTSSAPNFGSYFVNPGGGALFNNTFNPDNYYAEPFIMDFDSTGHVKYGTFIKASSSGGHGFANAMDFDSNGNLYIVGQQSNLPAVTKTGGYNNTGITGGAYIIELSNTYSQIWGTYIDANSSATAAKVDASNNLWIFGGTGGSTLPTHSTGSAYIDNTLGGSSDNFLAKFSSAGVQLWTTYLGGSADEYCSTEGSNSIAFSSSSVYFVGSTQSSDFPVKNAGGSSFFDNTLSTKPFPETDIGDGYVVEFNLSTMAQNWGTLVSGDGSSEFVAVAVDPTTSNLVVAGSTGDTAINLTNPGGGAYFQNQFSTTAHYGYPQEEGYIISFNSSRQIIWSTLYGGNNDNGYTGNEIYDISFDPSASSSLYATGATTSENNTAVDPNSLNPAFPLYNPGASAYFRGTFNGGVQDAFVANFCLEATFSGIAFVKTSGTDALHIYPNPTSDKLYIELPEQNNNGTFVIYDVSGQEVYQGQYKDDSPIVSVSTSSFAPGIYIVKIMSNQGMSVGKFIKE